MEKKKIWECIILGCGRLGSKLKSRLEVNGMNVLGVRRQDFPKDENMLSADLCCESSWLTLLDEQFSDNACFVITLTPSERSESAYRASYIDITLKFVDFALKLRKPIRIIWVSSTSVFGDQTGFLCESVKPIPKGWRGEILLEAEKKILRSGLTYTIIRFAGLYEKSSLKRLERLVSKNTINIDSVANRFHREDAVNWLEHLVAMNRNNQRAPRLVHGVDMCSISYRSLFDLLDGKLEQVKPAKAGRIITTHLRYLMPKLIFPNCAYGFELIKPYINT